MKEKKCKILCFTLCIIMILSAISTVTFAATALYSLTVTVENGVGGEVQIDGGNVDTYAQENDIAVDEERTITFLPDRGYEIDTVTVNGTPVSVTRNSYTIKMDEQKDVSVSFKRTTASFSVMKKDDSGNVLEGAKFKLVLNGQSLDEYEATSGANGIATFTNIPVGVYNLYEQVAPYGYIASDAVYDVTINSQGANGDIEIYQRNAPVGTVANQTVFMDGDTIAEFVNVKAQTETIKIEIKKTVNGDNAPRQAFTFEVLRIVGEDDNGNLYFEVVEEITDVYVGDTTHTINIPVNELGNMCLREQKGNSKAWTYSEKVYGIDVDQQGNKVTYIDIDNPNNPALNSAEFINEYDSKADEWQLDGIYHWQFNDSGEEINKDKHKDEDGDDICDVCNHNMPEDNDNNEPVADNDTEEPKVEEEPGKAKVTNNPQTGDNIIVFVVIAVVAVAGIIVILKLKNKKQTNIND